MAADLENLIRSRAARKVCNLSARLTGAERRRQLIDAATAVFSQKGFSGSTTKEIAAKARVNEALLFRHFGGKEALYEAVIDDKFNDLKNSPLCRQMRDSAKRDDDEGVFMSAANLLQNRYRSERDVLRILIFGILEHRPHIVERFENEMLPLRDFLVDYIERRQAAGALFTENAGLAVFGFIGVITHHATLAELIGERSEGANDDEALKLYTNTILKSLRPN